MEQNISTETVEGGEKGETETKERAGQPGDIVEKLKAENDDLKMKLDVLTEQIEAVSHYSRPGLPSSQEEITEFLKAYKASELKLKQKSLELSRLEDLNNEMKVRLELEHERRVRAGMEIGEIEKEKVILQKELEKENGESVKLSEECEEIKSNCEYKISKYTTEIKKLEAKLERIQLEKDRKIFDLQDKNTELYLKLESSEEQMASQLEVATTLQNELQSSYAETQSLIKEMEMLNLMFAELDQHIFPSEVKVVVAESSPGELQVTDNGKQINVNEVLQVAQSTDYSPTLLEKSCFNEVTTKHGTKMVLSVSKTFLKLKDLILEKKTLEEQMTKMKHVNETLCSQVNLHEEKLCGITDELNNTWFYVSKIKEQHKKMHSAEQILRAELAEKRQLLKNIRKELEETRASWLVVKQKNAESEIQWLKLKADCDERRRILMSSSESGFSELCNSEKTDDTDTESIDKVRQESQDPEPEPEKSPSPEVERFEEDSESEEIPDPFSDDENDVEEIPQHFILPILTNTDEDLECRYDDDDDEEEEEEEEGAEVDTEKEKNSPTFTPIFVPSLSYLATVPADMQPQLLGQHEKELRALEEPRPARERLEENVLEEVDDNVRDLIIRLSSSTDRGAFLANRLVDIHRRIATGTSLTDHNDWFDNQPEEETETDISPREEDDELTVPSPEIQSDFDDIAPLEQDKDLTEEGEDEDEDEELSRSASVDSLVLAIDEAINILDPVNSHPQLMSFLSINSRSSPPAADLTPHHEEEQEEDHGEEEDGDGDGDVALAVAGLASEVGGGGGGSGQSQDSSTAVTRYLIKHLPKQLTQLRNQKHELEDKITDLEQVISEQRTQNAEYERRAEVERSRARKLEDRLREIEEKVTASEARIENVTLPVTYKVPVEVETEDMRLKWTVDTQSENVCGYYISFVTRGDSQENAVILPNMVTEVSPSTMGIITTLEVLCSYRGTYILHIEGNGAKMPEVTMNLAPLHGEVTEQ